MAWPEVLERLWADLDLPDPAELTVVVEPTRNAWMCWRSGSVATVHAW
nr:hypothetical protein [Rhodococcus sp. DK17]